MSQLPSSRSNEQSDSVTLTRSHHHRILSSERRRTLLDVLGDRSTPMDLEELSALVSRREGDRSGSPTDVEAVAITLHHNHLPILARAGIVEYRPATKRVESFRELQR